ncbi:MAG: agmatinase [Candidatus Kerfeldbacteria bacterium]|nr:agmatinase [Candidatus Kerfeldbacteria bacterium]
MQADPAFVGIRTFMHLPHRRATKRLDYAIVGLPFDTGASFGVGSRFGPAAIRAASMLLRPYNPALSVHISRQLEGIDYGDIPITPGDAAASLQTISRRLARLHRQGVVPIALGGDHSVALGELRAAASVHGPVHLVLFDSHPDTWDTYFGSPYGHSTPFRRAVEERLLDPDRSIICGLRGTLFDANDWDDARRMGFMLVTAEEMHTGGLLTLPERIRQRVGQGPVFMSFDIDFLDPAFAPGTGTPEIGGFTTRDAQYLIRGLKGVTLVAADVVEVLPSTDYCSITAYAAANLVYEMLSVLAYSNRNAALLRGDVCLEKP